MDQKVHELRRSILRYLDEQVLMKPEEQRTQLDALLLETGRAFTDALVRQERGMTFTTGAEAPFLRVAKGYNAINAERARRDLDAEALAMFRSAGDSDGE